MTIGRARRIRVVDLSVVIERRQGRRRMRPSRPHQTTPANRGHGQVVITMGCGDACPIYPGKRYLDWELDDPAGKALDEVRPIRNEIDRRVQELLQELVNPTS